MSTDEIKETYLGDGLYASWDGWHFRLRAPRDGGDHWVALEINPEALSRFMDFVAQVNRYKGTSTGV